MPSIYDALPRSSPEAFALVEHGDRATLGSRDRAQADSTLDGPAVTLQWRDGAGRWKAYATFRKDGTIILTGPDRLPLAMARRMSRVAPFGWAVERNRYWYSRRGGWLLRFRGNYTLEWEGYAAFMPDGSTRGWAGMSATLSLAELERYNRQSPRRYERPVPPRRRRRRAWALPPRRLRFAPQPDPGIEDPVDYAVEVPTPSGGSIRARDVLTQEQLAEAIDRLRTRAERTVYVPPAEPNPFDLGPMAEVTEWRSATVQPDGSIAYGDTPCYCDPCRDARRRFAPLPLDA